jgi:hypothetical protein
MMFVDNSSAVTHSRLFIPLTVKGVQTKGSYYVGSRDGWGGEGDLAPEVIKKYIFSKLIKCNRPHSRPTACKIGFLKDERERRPALVRISKIENSRRRGTHRSCLGHIIGCLSHYVIWSLWFPPFLIPPVRGRNDRGDSIFG